MLTIRTTPYSFQRKDVRLIERQGGRSGAFWDPGLGKSFLSLLFMARDQKERLPGIVICPAGLKTQWAREALHHLGMRSEVLDGMRPPLARMPLDIPLTIVSYEILEPWLDYLLSLDAKTLVVDEMHYCKSRTSKRSKNTHILASRIPYFLGLTGTPILSRTQDLFFPLHLTRPDLFPSWWPFAARYCDAKKGRFGWDTSGCSNLEELHERIKDCSVRRRKEEVLASLPKKRRIIVPLRLGGKERKEYDKALENFEEWILENSPERARRALRAEGLTKIGYLRRLVAELKLPAVKDWIDNFLESSDGKLIVFGVHKKVLHFLFDGYRGKSVLIDGGVTGRQRQQLLDHFLGGKQCRTLFGNIEAAGVGWSAKGVGTVLVVEPPWQPGKLIQAEDRIYGIGRGVEGRRPDVYYLVAEGTIEEWLLELNQRKQKISNQILDGKGKGEELDVYDQLIRKILGGGVYQRTKKNENA